MVAWAFVVTLQDAVVKLLAPHYPPGEIVFLRAFFTFLSLLPFLARKGGLAALKTRRYGAHAMRGVLFTISMMLFVVSVSLMPLADAITLTFTGPLFVTALAVPLLGETVGWRRSLAVAAGFLGVVVMLRPTENALNLVVLLPVASALASAIRDVVTRKIASTETILALNFHSNLGIALIALGTSPFGWTMPALEHLALFAVIGVFLALSEYLALLSFRHAEVSLVMPFKYLAAVWAVVLGYWIWGDVPDVYTWVGAAFVIGSGVYILHREALKHGR